MRSSIVWSGLAAAVVTLASGSAFSGGTSTTPAQLVSYDRTTSQLWAIPDSQPLTQYLNQKYTTYLEANLTSFEPPDPCIPTVAAWNFVVAYDQKNDVRSTFVYELLLDEMSNLRCRASVTSVTTGSPQPLVAIQPVE